MKKTGMGGLTPLPTLLIIKYPSVQFLICKGVGWRGGGRWNNPPPQTPGLPMLMYFSSKLINTNKSYAKLHSLLLVLQAQVEHAHCQ